jgi:cyclopropane-fatty-acyl-phospholipid synthase
MPLTDTAPLRHSIERLIPERPFEIDFWDGTSVPATRRGGPVFSVRSPRAVSYLLRSPGQLGLSRAYVSGELEVDDLDAVNRLVYEWTPPAFGRRTRLRLLLAAARAAGARVSLQLPTAELKSRGRLHSRARDARAVRHHYDVSNQFFALFLDRSMTYSCAFFSRDDSSLEAAQAAKLELTCQKLKLREAEQLDRRREEAVRLAGEERVRVWRLYLRGARSAFETGYDSIYQVQARKPVSG